jgi:RNA polymerase sigma factor (sigma-70 family)
METPMRLVDEDGKPLDPRVETALLSLIPRFRREYPPFHDDSLLVQALDLAAQKIARRERQAGPVENLYGYAWVTLRSVAVSWLRSGSGQVVQRTVTSASSARAIDGLSATAGSVDQIERQILLREILDRLTPDERLVCIWKKAGFSSAEIAAHRGTSAGAVDTLFSRTRDKVRRWIDRTATGPEQKSSAPGGDGDGQVTSQAETARDAD